MKKITIYSDESQELTLIDDDDTELTIYTKQVTKLLESPKICILETSSGNVVLKPSKISFVFVTELSLPEISEKPVSVVKPTVVSKVKNQSDVIKD